jgi:hypothetical protein
LLVQDKNLYFESVKEARSLQSRWKNEAGVDIIQRVVDKLRQTTNMKVQVAREGDDEYFVGVLRAVDRGIGVHADYAPYVSARHPRVFFFFLRPLASWLNHPIALLTIVASFRKLLVGKLATLSLKSPGTSFLMRSPGVTRLSTTDSGRPQMTTSHGAKNFQGIVTILRCSKDTRSKL